MIQSQGNFHGTMNYACINEWFYENFFGEKPNMSKGSLEKAILRMWL